ncbi:MAG: sigma-70 family RNA polymerase sigma factor [Candidatus Eisenbacteria bacterium]|uniref:Sigma-70 family RNA polymerase sigma factor n=1 Tax=Eiseniibacteriota bacterium TaxID=2212470 RepID=A0A956SF43_UNCEI|nr:sigma-70 family RNA polymerase sigma factor [Candidatus Eisenbacteria bacterium]MCB9464314.1 sigma-70 family RNA polymerase sigma factor [Candidatus Eisenbacteria bacterium]
MRADATTDPELGRQLFEIVYGEMRRLAGSILRGQRANHTLQATALVHEAYLRLVDKDVLDYRDRQHFFRVAARAMRHILIDYARRRSAEKRGGGADRVTLDEALGLAHDADLQAIELDRALEALSQEDPRAAQVVELRVFAGLSVNEVSEILGVSPRTVDGDWALARMWLNRALAEPK